MPFDVPVSLRKAFILLILFGAVGLVRAQDQHVSEPDSGAIAEYLPVEAGNIWEYAEYDEYSLPPTTPPIGYRVFEVLGDTVVDGEGYRTMSYASYGRDLELKVSGKLLVRRDSLGQLLRRDDNRESAYALSPLVNPGYYEHWKIAVDRDTTVQIGGMSYIVDAVRTARFDGSYSSFDERVHLNGIGLLTSSYCGLSCGGPPPRHYLVYAFVGGASYGRSVVATGTVHAKRTLERSLVVYPNPARSKINVLFSDGLTNGTFELEVVDLLGRQVRTIELRHGATGNAEVDVSDLPSGVYGIRAETNAGSLGKRFVIVRD